MRTTPAAAMAVAHAAHCQQLREYLCTVAWLARLRHDLLIGADRDSDTIVNFRDNCPGAANLYQSDWDQDGLGDICDPDDDNDGIRDGADPAPRNAAIPGTPPWNAWPPGGGGVYDADGRWNYSSLMDAAGQQIDCRA